MTTRSAQPLLRISVVTPSFNQGEFIEKTIQSVRAQGYPDLEHLVIDGGSTDATPGILARYRSGFAYCVSERDRGQGEAINKGLRRATGDVLCWLNSDDSFEPGALGYVGAYFHEHPEVDLIAGGVRRIDAEGRELKVDPGRYDGRRALLTYWRSYDMHQPSIFWRRRVYETLGGVNERLHLTMDFDYWLRAAKRFHLVSVDRILSSTILHDRQKTAGGYARYRRHQLRDALRHYGVPRRLGDVPSTVTLYGHLAMTAWRLCSRRPTVYSASAP